MKDYKEINKKFVWKSLIAGKKVNAVVFYSQYFASKIYNLKVMNVNEINRLLSEEEVVYFEKVEVKE